MRNEIDQGPITNNYLSFRDNAARVVKEEGKYFRYIFKAYEAEYNHLMNSGFYEELISNGYMIPHEEINSVEAHIGVVTNNYQNFYKKILPKQIGFQSYPFEWSFSQWQKAILAYLSINRLALKYGMILKDATPYNFYFESGRAVLLDTSSFAFFKNGDPWIAYRQFCSEFLSPIFLMHYNGLRWSRLTRTHISGLPLSFVSKQLPLNSWFNFSCLIHIHLHSRYSNDQVDKSEDNKIGEKKKGFTKEKIEFLLSSIQSNINRLGKDKSKVSHWQKYYEENIESADYLEHKVNVIKTWLDNIRPKSVLDLGANTGKFSFIASEFSEQVISLESDEISVESIDQMAEFNKYTNIRTVINDLAEPTPDIGVMGKEISSIFTRAKSEMVMGLAITHHLFINNRMNFDQISEMFARFSQKYLIIEFISKNDNKVKVLMKDKTINMDNYTEESFLESFSKYFKNKESVELKGSPRKLLLLEKIN